jgi:hypothetical protein
MAQRLNNYFLLLFIVLSGSLWSQKNSDGIQRTPDEEYQKPEGNNDFKKFSKRSRIISQWQVNQLKNGALVVRLTTNTTSIERLRQLGKTEAAEKKENETMAINKLYYRAFVKEYKFSKLYFIYSHFSDSLARGARTHIFLDSNLQVSDTIQMREKFYLLADKDVIYSSSIGFVKEEDAAKVKEVGTPSKDAFIVLKNKYGHQLKDPFPYYTLLNSFTKGEVGLDKEFMVTISKNGKNLTVPLNKMYNSTYLENKTNKINGRLNAFYNSCKGFEVKDSLMHKYLY